MDPGFFVGGGANPPGGGALTYDFAKMYQKLHEIEKSLGRNPYIHHWTVYQEMVIVA